MCNIQRSELITVWLKADLKKRSDTVLEYVRKKIGNGNFKPKHRKAVIRFCSDVQKNGDFPVGTLFSSKRGTTSGFQNNCILNLLLLAICSLRKLLISSLSGASDEELLISDREVLLSFHSQRK